MVKSKDLSKKKIENIKTINIGIQLLRMICCLLIILTHFYGFYHFRILSNKYPYYLKIFFFISFYFSYNSLSLKKIPKIIERFKRMLVPYIGWPLIFFIEDKLYQYLFKKKGMYNIKNLYYQILIGCGIYGIFWFIFNLIFITLFFTLIIFLFKKIFIFVLFIICIIDYCLYNSNYAPKHFFQKYKMIPVGHSILPICMYFNYNFTGFYFASINLSDKAFNYRKIFFIISSLFISIYFIFYFSFFEKIPFFFKSIVENIFVLNIFIFFVLLPFDKIKNKNLKACLNKITGYTGGIYYLHVKMDDLCEKFNIYLIKKRTFIGCLLIYLFCYLICLIGSFILRKNYLKNLFI